MNVSLYLTRRNLMTLLAMLDARRDGDETSSCMIVKKDTAHPVYPCSEPVSVVAVENEDYYTDREPGDVRAAPYRPSTRESLINSAFSLK